MMNGCNSATSTTEEVSVTIDEPARKVAGWYMGTVVKATADDGSEYVHNTAGIFGALEESKEGKDRHDVAGFGTAILQVVFLQKEWEEDSGEYFSDYRSWQNEESKNVWTFQVKNQRDVNLEHAFLKLSLNGPYDVYENKKVFKGYEEELSGDESKKTSITLIDIDNQTQYTYEELQSAQLGMDGLHVRTFRWVLGEVSQEDYAPLITSTVSAKQVSPLAKRSQSLSGSKFGVPPL